MAEVDLVEHALEQGLNRHHVPVNIPEPPGHADQQDQRGGQGDGPAAHPFALRDHVNEGNILGYTPKIEMFKKSQNSPENIRLGRLKLTIGIEPCPVFKLAQHEIRRYRPAVDNLVNEIIARLSNDL